MVLGWADSFVESETAKKLRRLTKEQMIEGAWACWRALYSYLSLMDRLKAALDILRDENTALLRRHNRLRKYMKRQMMTTSESGRTVQKNWTDWYGQFQMRYGCIET